MTAIYKNKIELIALAVSTLLALSNMLWPLTLLALSPYCLIAGMFAIGIPHGALDHDLGLLPQGKGAKVTFNIFYTLVMVTVFVIWKVAQPLGLIVFILYSSWHFGETDLQRYRSFKSWTAFLGGLSLLSFLLCSHPAEFNTYLQLFSINLPESSRAILTWIAIISLFIFCAIGMFSIHSRRLGYGALTLALIICSCLPLLLAFGVYFILVHSLTGWRDIKSDLHMTDLELYFKAIPLTAGALAIFLTVILIWEPINYLSMEYIPSFFIALSCIGAPHVLCMSGFYQLHRSKENALPDAAQL
jgi:Brp/Blh family beta-carotene 15,15'-monooxygenase